MKIEKFDLATLPDGNKLTLLKSYQILKMENYVPQERKQTSKEEFINFSKKKYLASLLFLKIGSNNLKILAKTAGVSYGLLRKWTTEKEFSKLVNNHHQEFVQLFFKYLELKTEKRSKILAEFLKKSVEEIAEEECPQPGIGEYEDMVQYSDMLQKRIQKVLIEKFQKFEKLSERDHIIKRKLRSHALGGRESLSNVETVDGLIKEMSEVSGELTNLYALKTELYLVFDKLHSVIKVTGNKKKYAIINSMHGPKAQSSKVVNFPYVKDSKSWLLFAQNTLIDNSIDYKRKEGKVIKKKKPLTEKNVKLAVYAFSLSLSSMD